MKKSKLRIALAIVGYAFLVLLIGYVIHTFNLTVEQWQG